MPALLQAGAAVDLAVIEVAAVTFRPQLGLLLAYSPSPPPAQLVHPLIAADPGGDTVLALVRHGCDPDTRNKRGETPLWVYGTQRHSVRMLTELLLLGASPDLAPRKKPPMCALLADKRPNTDYVRVATHTIPGSFVTESGR